VLAKDIGVPKLLLETYSSSVAAKVKSLEMDRSSHGPLVEEIKMKVLACL
jgi:hypothetical protein